MKQSIRICILALLIMGGGSGALSQEFVPPRLSAYATDQTGTLSAGDLSELNASLKAFDDSTSTQIVVLMVTTTGDYAVEEAALKVAEVNQIGRKGKDNGILLFVAKDDRAVRIEVGYGLEGVLPDILAGQIMRNEIFPEFRKGDYAGGIRAGVDAIMRATRNEYKAEPRKKGPSGNTGLFVIAAIIILIIIAMNRRGGGPTSGAGPGSRRLFGPFLFFPPGGSWGGRGGSWGGGFGGFGGGGGGFSGGGGSFGGGGASGHW
jgi:uncharacterized protein